MAYKCEKCQEENDFKDIVDGILKIAILVGVIFLIYWVTTNFGPQIKSAVAQAVKKMPAA